MKGFLATCHGHGALLALRETYRNRAIPVHHSGSTKGRVLRVGELFASLSVVPSIASSLVRSRFRDSVMRSNIPPDEIQRLFDSVPDVLFFIKDEAGRYTHCNLTLMRRLNKKRRSEIIGLTSIDLYPPSLGSSYFMQDRRVLYGEVIENQLEVHLHPNRMPGWGLTFKRPLVSGNEITGIIGITRDLGRPNNRYAGYQRLRQVVDHMEHNFQGNLRIQALAKMAGLSVAQLERHFRHVFQLTPQQLLIKIRIEAAMRLLQGKDSIASIGQACGFADQSAFSRQFKSTVGVTPRDYRSIAGKI